MDNVVCMQTMAWQGGAVLSKRAGAGDAAASEQVLRSAASSSVRLAVPLKAAAAAAQASSRCECLCCPIRQCLQAQCQAFM